MKVIALFAVMILAMSAKTERIFHPSEGHAAPTLELTTPKGESIEPLAKLRGDYVLLTFWASTDAESRVAAKAYERTATRPSNRHLRHLAVNLDQSERLFREIIRRDGLKAEAQFHAGDAASAEALTKNWHLKEGFHSFLINPQGMIIAVDPNNETLTKFTT